MYRKIAGMLFIMTLVFQNGCGTGKYADIKKVMGGIIDARERFAANAERAETPEEAADAITSLSAEMKKLRPRYEELEKKYPELQNPGDLPLELKELVESLGRTAEQRDSELTDIMMQYPDDPLVQRAVASMGTIYK